MLSSQRLAGRKLGLNLRGLLFLETRQTAHHGELESISVRQCEKALFMGFELVLGDLGEDSRKQDVALDWMLSGNGVIL